jgi:LysR family hydrogen peroxide-inducible transcriptional activator
MNLRDLEYFVAVAESGHFHTAAQRCFVSQPTLSGQIKKLEQALGHPLFERDTRTVRLSNFGREALEIARRCLSAAQELENRAKALHDPLVGPVSIGSFPTLSPWFFPRLSPELSKQFPQVEFFLTEEKTSVLVDALRNRSLDAAFLALPLDNDDLFVQALFHESFFLAVAANHPWAKLESIDALALEKQDLLLLADGHCLRTQALDLCRRYGAKESKTFQATSLETLRQMVRLGRGMTLIPRLAVPDHKSDGIIYLPITQADFHRQIGLVYRPTHPRQQFFKALAELVKTVFEECCA